MGGEYPTDSSINHGRLSNPANIKEIPALILELLSYGPV
jgi:hypothetical protein